MKIGDIELMICSRCNQSKIKTKSGICLVCNPNVIHGLEVKNKIVASKNGCTVESKTGNKKENAELSDTFTWQ